MNKKYIRELEIKGVLYREYKAEPAGINDYGAEHLCYRLTRGNKLDWCAYFCNGKCMSKTVYNCFENNTIIKKVRIRKKLSNSFSQKK